jgi:DNA-binding MarR family transcriptional regulator
LPRASKSRPSVAERAQEPVSLGLLERMLGFHLRRAQLAVWRDFFEGPVDPDLRPALFAILTMVQANPGIAQMELARELGIDETSLVALINVLERKDWVQRRRSDSDRRRKGLFLSSAGGERLAQMTARVRRHEGRLRARLRPGEAATLIAALRRLYRPQR